MSQPSVEGSVIGGLVENGVKTVAQTLSSPPYISAASSIPSSEAIKNSALDLTSPLFSASKTLSSNGSVVKGTSNADNTYPSLKSITALISDTQLKNSALIDPSVPTFLKNCESKKRKSPEPLLSHVPLSSLPHDDSIRKAHRVNLSAGLSTIDTSSLSTIDASYTTGGTFDSSPPKLSRRVTAYGTVIPPIASCLNEVANGNTRLSHEDTSPPSSPSPLLGKSRPNSQLSHQSFPGDNLSSTSKSGSCKSASPVDIIKSPLSVPSSPQPTNHVTMKSPASVNSPQRGGHTQSPPALPSPASSPFVTAAGSEVKGMPAIPVVPNHSAKASSEKHSADKSCAVDGGRLTFFKEGKLLLELSHRISEGRGTEKRIDWVEIKNSKTYWPPPSSRSALQSASSFPVLIKKDCEVPIKVSRKRDTPLHNHIPDSFSPFLFKLNAVVRRRWGLAGPLKKRNSLSRIVCHNRPPNVETDSRIKVKKKLEKTSSCKDFSFDERIASLHVKAGAQVDTEIKLSNLLEKSLGDSSPSGNNFVSPRKRYLRQMEADPSEVHQRKRQMSALASSQASNSSCNNSSSNSQLLQVNRNLGSYAKTSSNSPYSIDVLLNSSEKKNEHYLKTAMKSEIGSAAHCSNSPLKGRESENIKQEVEALAYERDRKQHHAPSPYGGWHHDGSSRDDIRKDNGTHNSRYPPHSSQSRQSHHHILPSRPPSKGAETTSGGLPPHSVAAANAGYNALVASQANLAALYPQLYDPNYILGLTAAGGLMSNPHNQMAVAAAAAAAAAASISSISSYGLGSIQLSALAATQYFNSALNPAALAAAAAAPLNQSLAAAANLPAALTPALTPGAPPAVHLPPAPPSIPPPTLTPGMSPALPPSTYPSYSLAPPLSHSASSHQYASSRSSPYPSPSPRSAYPSSRSPYSPTTKSSYPHAKSPPAHQQHSQKDYHLPPKSPKPSSQIPLHYSLLPKTQSPYQSSNPYASPSTPWNHSSSAGARTAALLDKPQVDISASVQDMPLNLSKPRTN